MSWVVSSDIAMSGARVNNVLDVKVSRESTNMYVPAGGYLGVSRGNRGNIVTSLPMVVGSRHDPYRCCFKRNFTK